MAVKGRDEAVETSEKVELNAGALRVTSTLQREDYYPFKNACAALRESENQSIFIDLTRCAYISSLFIGELAEAIMNMKSAGKDVHVEVSPEIGKTFYMARLYHLFDYEISSDNV